MKKIFFAAFISLFVMSCTDKDKKEDNGSGKNADMQALYEANLASLKASIAAFEKEDLETWAANIADSVVWSSPAYGDTVSTKAHYKESIKYYFDNWDNLKLNNPIFLPGIDTTTHQMDGGVRYYGSWDGVHTGTGKTTKTKFYGFYQFNSDHKVIRGGDYFDLGGLLKAVESDSK